MSVYIGLPLKKKNLDFPQQRSTPLSVYTTVSKNPSPIYEHLSYLLCFAVTDAAAVISSAHAHSQSARVYLQCRFP